MTGDDWPAVPMASPDTRRWPLPADSLDMPLIYVTYPLGCCKTTFHRSAGEYPASIMVDGAGAETEELSGTRRQTLSGVEAGSNSAPATGAWNIYDGFACDGLPDME